MDDFFTLLEECEPPRNPVLPPLAAARDREFASDLIFLSKLLVKYVLMKSKVNERCIHFSLLYICSKNAAFCYALSLLRQNCSELRRFLDDPSKCKDIKNVGIVESLRSALARSFYGFP